MNVETHRNEKDNSDDNYVKEKDNPEKKNQIWKLYSSIFRHEFELLQISKKAQLVQKVIKPSTFLCLQLYKTLS